MTTKQRALQLLQQALNDPNAQFRDGQWEAIDAIVNRREKLLLVQRTGWGKSSVYFVSTRILRDRGMGLTLIVSPLLALMRNQIDAAKCLHIQATSINSANPSDWPQIIGDIQADQVDALLISPERFANESFVQDVLLPVTNRIGLLVVDEAHCISDWGHDFRPDYRRLGNVLRAMPANIPILATTATANNRVIEDIQAQLGNITVQRGTLARESLALQTLRMPDQAERLAWLAEHLPHLPGTGIVYTLTRRDADQVAKWLNQHGIQAHAYYSDVTGEGEEDSSTYRQKLETLLSSNTIKAIIATTALGMGYDKPDLGFVIHYQAPGSIIAYYQQVGRAGRAIDHAVGVLMIGDEDRDIHEYFRATAFPSADDVSAILDVLEASETGLTVRDLEAAVNLSNGQIEKVLKYLSVEHPSPVIKQGNRWMRTPVPWQMDHEKIHRLTRQREEEWHQVLVYARTNDCLMWFLTHALDDPDPKPCGTCANCLGRSVVPTTASHHLVMEATRYLKRSELPLECKKQVASDAFAIYGFRGNLPPEQRAATGRILSRWGDAGLGCMVAEDKLGGHFRDELVAAAVEMITDRWRPHPTPTWVTCIPSNRHPELVPDFAKRLADCLNLPFVEALIKVRENEPQKLQQNRYHQCRNLDGVFAVSGSVPQGPVLLVDDIVDSGWTLTIAAALLRQAGCSLVYPIALASTNKSV